MNVLVAYGMAKAATNKMTETMVYELKEHNISVITVYSGLVRTESVIRLRLRQCGIMALKILSQFH